MNEYAINFSALLRHYVGLHVFEDEAKIEFELTGSELWRSLIEMNQAILLVCSVLTVADGLLTWWGTLKGFRELNPFLRHVLRKGGSMGLITTRAVALGLLFLLFNLLNVGLWTFFGSTFALLLGLIVSNDVKKLCLRK